VEARLPQKKVEAEAHAEPPIPPPMGLTTDSEAANTGSKSGLWKKLKDKLGRGFLTFWCTAHRSDLAFEELETVA